MERVLIGLLVLGFMMGTMLVAARLAVSGPGPSVDRPASTDGSREAGRPPAEPASLVDTALRSALD